MKKILIGILILLAVFFNSSHVGISFSADEYLDNGINGGLAKDIKEYMWRQERIVALIAAYNRANFEQGSEIAYFESMKKVSENFLEEFKKN